VTVWSQPWLSSSKLTDFQCEAMTDNNVNHVRRMPERSVGGHRPVDMSGDQVKQAVDFVMKYLNSESDDLYSLALFQVVNGTQQVGMICTSVCFESSSKRCQNQHAPCRVGRFKSVRFKSLISIAI